MQEFIFGWAGVEGQAGQLEVGVVRHVVRRALVVAERVVRADCGMLLLRPPCESGCQRIAANGQSLLVWAGHVVTPALPLWPSAPELLEHLRALPLGSWADLDGLFALGWFDESSRTLILAADPFGMHPLYVSRCGRGWVFSNSLDLILHSLPGPLTLNQTAAAEYLHFHYCLGDKTLTNEVERLPQGCALTLHLDTGRVQKDTLWRLTALPAPADEGPGDGEAADSVVDDLVAALDGAVARRLQHSGDNLCLLSGGWDSRALCGLMAQRGLSFQTLTTYGDVGTLDDPDAARMVADELQLINTYVPLPADYLARHWREKCVATDFATTMHTWLWPLTQRHGFAGAVNMDGIAGDAALKGLLLKPEHLTLLRQGRDADLVDALWGHHGVADTLQRCLHPEVASEWTDRSRHSLAQAVGQWHGHPNTLSFFVLSNRTRRAIAASPCMLLERRLRNVAPFLDRDFMALAMAVPPGQKLSGDLYRRLLRTIRPALADIPSSNDKTWPNDLPRRRRPVLSTNARPSYQAETQLAANRLSPWIKPEFLSREAYATADRPASAVAELRINQALGELAYWMNEYDVG